MKKCVSLVALLALAAALILTSCHGARGMTPFEMPESFDTDRNYEITFWAKNDTNNTQKQVYSKAASDFESLYPNIKVNIRFYTDYNEIYKDAITNIATETTPNVCISYPDHIATYMTGANVVVPLNSLINDAKYGMGGSEVRFDSVKKEEIVPKFLEECAFGDTYYALPFMRSTEACYINKDLVEKLGYEIPDILTWDFIWEVSEKALQKDENGLYVNGQNVMIPFIYKSSDNMLITMLRQLGAGYSDPSGSIKIFNDATTGVLKEISSHAGTRAFSTFTISSYPGNHFNAGRCIFALDSTAGATWIGSDAPLMDIHSSDVVSFETVVRPVPQYDTENPRMISQGPSICLFNKDDKQEVLASWLFMQFLLTNETQINYSFTEGYVPVTLKAQNDPAYKDYINYSGEPDDLHYKIKLEASRLLLDNMDNTFITPVFNGSASLRSAAGYLVDSSAKAARRGETQDDEFFGKLYRDAAAMYHISEYPSSIVPAVILIATLCTAWAAIIAVFIVQKVKKSKE